MYWGYTAPYRAPFQPIWAMPTNQVLEMMEQAVQGERNDELFYDQLIRLAPTQEDVAVITSIRNDERGHNVMFRQMYQDLTGRPITGVSSEEAPKVASYPEGLQQALMGELGAVERYRQIWFGLPNGIYKDTVFGIILDESKHATKYNFLLEKYFRKS